MDITLNPPLLSDLARIETEDQSAETQTAAASAAADFDSFLNLLTAQLRNQDPLQPIDSTQFVAQLASFSTVEQLIGTNERLDTLAAQSNSDQSASLASWIGREVSLTDGTFEATGQPVSFTTPGEPGATSGVATVRRPDGTALSEIPVSPGVSETLEWDGTNANGALVGGEPLMIDVAYFDGETLLSQRPAQVFREVSGIRGTNDGLVLELADGGTVTPTQVASLRAMPVEEE
ncbi:MAG: flagellar hook capping FlgD N-terminal domain-containing protein [Pseudomonadota bacterium]